MLLKENHPSLLPIGLKMSSSQGVPMIALACMRHSDTHLKVSDFVPLDFMTRCSASTFVLSDLHLYDQRRILEGFLYPEIGWTVDSIPGLSSMPKITYHCQEVPPPLNAWTSVESTDSDLLFGHNCNARGLRVHSGDAMTTPLTA